MAGEEVPGEEVPGEEVPGEEVPGEKVVRIVCSSNLEDVYFISNTAKFKSVLSEVDTVH